MFIVGFVAECFIDAHSITLNYSETWHALANNIANCWILYGRFVNGGWFGGWGARSGDRRWRFNVCGARSGDRRWRFSVCGARFSDRRWRFSVCGARFSDRRMVQRSLCQVQRSEHRVRRLRAKVWRLRRRVQRPTRGSALSAWGATGSTFPGFFTVTVGVSYVNILVGNYNCLKMRG